MPSLPSQIYNRLAAALLRCGPFESDLALRAVFIDERINAWQDTLPEAHSRAERVAILIDYLAKHYTAEQNSVLALFLYVVSELHHPSNVCRQELIELADEIAQIPKDNIGFSNHARKQISQRGFYMRFANLFEISIAFSFAIGCTALFFYNLNRHILGTQPSFLRHYWWIILINTYLISRWVISFLLRKRLNLEWIRNKPNSIMRIVQILFIVITTALLFYG